MRNGKHACKICDWMRVSEKKSKIIKFLLNMRKGTTCFVSRLWYKICSIHKCLFISEMFCFSIAPNLLFVNTAKLLLESRSRHVISVLFSLHVTQSTWTPDRGGTRSELPESTPVGFCVFLSDPHPESLFHFGSSRSLCGHFLGKNMGK